MAGVEPGLLGQGFAGETVVGGEARLELVRPPQDDLDEGRLGQEVASLAAPYFLGFLGREDSSQALGPVDPSEIRPIPKQNLIYFVFRLKKRVYLQQTVSKTVGDGQPALPHIKIVSGQEGSAGELQRD